MINEQEIIYKINSNEIIKILSNQNDAFQIDDIIINYFGDRKEIKNNIKKKDLTNSLLFINYKEIYIGGVSIYDITKREKFGLNIYSKDSFYLGQWKNNTKHGTGFLKINNNIMYIGSFVKNQLNGFGMLFYKNEELLYFGNFIEGKFNDGLCYNKVKDNFYRGKIVNGMKNDRFCTYFEINKGHLFLGEIIDDIFIKGYLGICEISQGNIKNETGIEEEIINFKLQKIIYFDKSDKSKKMNIIHCNLFTIDFYDKVQEFMNKVFQADYNLKDQISSIIDYFISFDNYLNDRDYIDYMIKYNQSDDEQSLENLFLKEYEEYYKRFKDGQEILEFVNYNDIIGPPEIIKEK